ncbi:hypothetical protein BCR42DRAFT_399279 [Absidia repens]|uniref:SH3 domain-containing protein n=1 Tax=Absidia repens TaxID=90262 RepID=A0A1X2IZR4_9FUNG|nr:hypothetical protein BCR42DRAFT_399279 [Absidia repens]
MAASVKPPLTLQFADAFWDEQYYGVDVIDQRITNAKQTCEEIKKLYEIRSQMEGEYGDRLLKLSQLIVGQDDDGTLAESLSHIPSALETTARAHMDLAQQLLHHLQSPLDNFIKEQGEIYAAKHRRIQDKIKTRKVSYEHMVKTKDDYTSKCARLKEIYRYLEEYTASPDEQRQAEADRDACLETIRLAEQEYRQSIDTYNNHTMLWMDDWRSTCDIYQQLEEKRIRFIRSSLWAFANMMSSVYIVDDQCCERIRTALELTDVDKDILAFVEKHGTGKVLPEFAEFEDALPHMSPVHDSNSDQQHGSIEIKDLPTLPVTAINKDEDLSEHITPIQHNDVEGTSDRSVQRQSQQQQELHSVPPNSLDDPTAHKQPTENGTSTIQPQENAAHQQMSTPSQDRSINDSKPPNTPQPAGLASTIDTKRPSSIKSFESGGQQLRFKPVPNPAFAARNKENQSSSPSMENANKKKPQSPDNNTEYDNDQQLAELISTAALVAAGNDDEIDHHKRTAMTENTKDIAKNDDAIHLSDDESEDSYNIPVRPPPKNEKWVISSIRRPQMVPVRSTNAHLFDGTPSTRASMIRSSIAIADVNVEQQQWQQQQQQHNQSTVPNDQHSSPLQQEESHEVGTSAKMNRPHPALKIDIPNKNETKAAAQEAIAAGRAHTQNIPHPTQQQSYSHPQQQQQQQHQQHQQQQQQQQQNDTGGIRPPPWQQEGTSSTPQHQHSYNQYETSHHEHRYSQQQHMYGQPQQQQGGGGGLHRYGSVSGPRVAPEIITTDLDNDNTNGKMGKNGNEFSKFMKGVLKSNDDPNTKPTGSALPQELSASTSANKKDKSGRFSLGIFGNKKDKDKRNQKDGRDSMMQRTPPPGDVLISGPPGGGPVVMPGDTNTMHSYYNNNNNTNSINNGRPNGAMATSSTVIATTQPIDESNNIPNVSGHSLDQQQQQQPNGVPTGISTLQPVDSLDDRNQLSDGTPIMHYARAIWSFTATIPLEMTFSAGDRLAIVKKQADGWWDAELQGSNKSRGLVPGNYMEME